MHELMSSGSNKREDKKDPTDQRTFPQRKRRETPERHEQGQKQGTTTEVSLTVTCISSLDAVESDFILIALKDHVSSFIPAGLLP